MSKIAAYTKAFFNHENYHGWFKKKRFFEGWYYKIVDKSETNALAIIPGIAMDTNGNKQAFIQVLDGKKITAEYFKFDTHFFKPSKKKFKLNIQDNQFTLHRIKLNLPKIQGLLHFDEHFLWPKKLTAPGIMGWYSFVPFMECYHQVVSMDFAVTGKLIINKKEIDFTGGRGYLEKDWGKSFPSSWLWMQSNHFLENNCSFKFSVAKIPFLTGAFVGFICAFMRDDALMIFASYTGAKLKNIQIEEHTITILLEDREHRLEIIANRAEGAELQSPVLGLMDGRVKESMNAVIHITLLHKKENRVIFKDAGRNAGLEIAGNTDELMNFD